jgi:beta-alanine--pyruvate transaminase
VGLAVGIDLAARAGSPGLRGYEVMDRAFRDDGILVRVAGDTIALSPPLIASEAEIGEIFDKLGKAIRAVA